MNYKIISDFAPRSSNVSNDPLFYCMLDSLDSQFVNGSTGRTFGKGNRQCALYMSTRCAQNWDGICDIAAASTDTRFPDMSNNYDGCCARATAGDLLVRDTAYLKYLLNANGSNVLCAPFDPTVANSPTICYLSHNAPALGDSHAVSGGVWAGGAVQSVSSARDGSGPREYGLTDAQIAAIDQDPVMNRLLDRPDIAPLLLRGIRASLEHRGQLARLKGTRLGRFYGL